MSDLEHFTVHEAEFAVYHAWRDGMVVNGPLDRHHTSSIISKFTSGLRVTRNPESEGVGGFGDWRAAHSPMGPSLWTVETSAAFAAVFDHTAQLPSFLMPGMPLVLLVRFYSSETGRWRLLQFHDAELGGTDVGESSQNMMQAVSFRAGWMEEITGVGGGTLPPMVPVLRGVLEWRHLGRRIACWYYDPEEDAWTENPENVVGEGEEASRFITMEEDEGVTFVSFMTPFTQAATEPMAGLPGVKRAWMNARVMQLASSGLTLEPGWEVQREAAEPIAMHASGAHWDHSRMVFRFLGRIYATVTHGLFCVPTFQEGAVVPFDFPIRIGPLVLLPDGAWVIPEEEEPEP